MQCCLPCLESLRLQSCKSAAQQAPVQCCYVRRTLVQVLRGGGVCVGRHKHAQPADRLVSRGRAVMVWSSVGPHRFVPCFSDSVGFAIAAERLCS